MFIYDKFYGVIHHLHLGFVHPLQDVALHQCLPSSSVCCFPNPGGSSFSVMSSCHRLLGCPLDLFPLLCCHSVHRLVHLLSFNLSVWPAHFHFCFSVYSMISMIFVLFLISEHGISSLRRELSHVYSSGSGAIVCKSRATHTALITCYLQCAIWYEGAAQLLSLTELKSHLFELYFIG